ncbi:cytochrome c biogenesis protein CcdA [Nocardioides marmoraquaticus]
MQEVVLSGPLLAAVPVAALAGVLSFFTPCSLPLVPGYLSYVAGMAGADGSPVTAELRGDAVPRRQRARVVLGAVLFVGGFAAVFTVYGALFGAVGAVLVAHQDTVIRVSGVLTIAMGLLFAGLGQRLPVLGRTIRVIAAPRAGLLGAPLLGAAFGVGWTPCIGPALAAVLALATSASTAGRGAALSFVYALGLGIPFVLAALSLTRAMRVFAWVRRRTRWLTVGGGVVLVVVGLTQVTGVWSALIASLQGTLLAWQPPI